MRLGWRLVVAGAVAMLAGPALTLAAGDLQRFFGSYVGRAEEKAPNGQAAEQRDIDLVIAPEGKNGLVITWTNVTLVDGRRDVPGVRRRTDAMALAPAPDREFYLARAPYDPFSERRAPDALAGDPLRWATVDGDVLRTYSFVLLDDGRYELQVYTRTLTGAGIDLDWQRYVDGELARQMTGHTVRAD